MADRVVEVQGLSRRFGKNAALVDVDYQADQGKIFGLVGANGAGKTTFMRHLLGTLRAQTGTVRIFGCDPARNPVGVLANIGYLSERKELPEWMTVDEYLRFTKSFYSNWDSEFSDALVTSFDLDAQTRIEHLSEGARARVALIAAVGHRPRLLLLDEPSSGLDALVRQDILETIVKAVVDDGRTVIFSSHLLEEVERLSDHVTMIHEGRVTLDGDLESLHSSHQISSIRFDERLDRLPKIAGALGGRGDGRLWHVIHVCPAEKLSASLRSVGGEIIESRNATLTEIFAAHAGRGHSLKIA